MANTIALNVSPGSRRDEIVANLSGVKPGMFMERLTGGKGQPHSTPAGPFETMVALEDGLRGKTVSDSFAQNDPVPVLFALPGDEVQLILKGGESVSEGDPLVSATGGLVKGLAVSGSVTELVTAIALESKNLAASSDALIKARIIPQYDVTSPV